MKLSVLIAIIAALAVAPSASAKGSVPYRVCGETACVAIADGPNAMVVFYAHTSRPEPPAAPYYRLDYHAAGVSPHYYVPATNLIGANADRSGVLQWFSLVGPALGEIRTAIRGLEPFAAPDAWPPSVADGGDDALPWLPVAAILIVSFAAGASLAHRLRVRRPTTA